MSDPVRSRPSNIAILVLAAGWSSRMGALKPLLPFGNGTVLGHVLSTIETAAIGPAYVVVGNEAGRVAPAAVARGAVAVANPAFAEGMMSSIKAGISALPETVDGAMILPVDVPLVRASTLERIAACAGSGDAAVVRPTFHGRAGHPPFVSRQLFAEIVAAPPEMTLRDVIERHQGEARSVAVIDSGIVRDMDYPDDYRRLAAALPHRLHPDEAECEAMLEAADTPEPTRRHSRVVARLAVDIAARLAARGHALDSAAVLAGALLHDIAKGDLDHAAAGARRVSAFGFAEVAEIVAVHMECALEPGQTVDPRHVVFLADKLVKGERLVGIEQRFAPAFKAFASDPAALAGVRRRHAAVAGVLTAVEAVTGPLSEAHGLAELAMPAGSGE
ncbi:Bifunctional protein GlmU [Pleomorphomonas sp. T1.2MG-36]|uniref:DVU_1551 family NTP transferase n=1 Tax=Pleomorphomonas sp. T1.2MG-36 TaxID=3041167 RepID=UPI00247764CD|nr:NTP transferase domain-containing protein [Pleomorphomonas sp. T1.2MG-36]CAI9406227.1 Bifunctional protein GlmU [Pleomorphomonas sp. T1.2MG-36]